MSTIEARQRIVTALENGAEISEHTHFEEWLEIMLGFDTRHKPICGLDFSDIYESVKGMSGKLKCFEYDNIVDLKSNMGKELDYDSKAVIVAIKLPHNEHELDMVKEIAETLATSVNVDSELLWQATNHNRKMLKVILLELK